MSRVHRIFRIDVGQLPPQKAMEFLERFKKEIETNDKPENYFDYFIPVKNEDSGVEIIETEVFNNFTGE